MLAFALPEGAAADVDVERFLPLLAEARLCLEALGDSRDSLRALEERWCLPSDEDEEPDVELPPVEADPPL